MTKQIGTGTFTPEATARLLKDSGGVEAYLAHCLSVAWKEEITAEDVVFNGNNAQDALEALGADRFEEDLVVEALEAAGLDDEFDMSYLDDFEALVLLIEVTRGRNV
jgi:hypothetical protein|tara:strand:+ start:25137 stop:25457 length:321 start_codon:yes stop_codon:yes gene_type:complete